MAREARLRQYNGACAAKRMDTTSTADTIITRAAASRRLALPAVTIGATRREGHRSVRAQASA